MESISFFFSGCDREIFTNKIKNMYEKSDMIDN